MFWPFVLPSQITIVLFIVAAIWAATILEKRGRSINWVIFLGPLLAILGFVPVCAIVQTVIDPFRFGVFTYADFDAVNDRRIEKYLPPQAIDLTVHKHMNGYEAKFTISQKVLDEWFEKWSLDHREYYSSSESEIKPAEWFEEEYYTGQFEGIDVTFSPGMLEYSGPRAADGAGFTIWYDPKTSTAYEIAADW